MFGIGIMELVILAIVGLLVLGIVVAVVLAAAGSKGRGERP